HASRPADARRELLGAARPVDAREDDLLERARSERPHRQPRPQVERRGRRRRRENPLPTCADPRAAGGEEHAAKGGDPEPGPRHRLVIMPKTLTGAELQLDDAPAREAEPFLLDGHNPAYP